MGFWSKIKKGIKKVADTVENFANDVGDAIGDTVEAVGDGINDALNWIGDKIGIKPFFSWLGGIIKGAFSLLGAIIKGAFGILGGIIGGIIKIIGGILTLDGSLILEGLWDIGSSVVGTIILVGGKLIALVQSVFYLQEFERPLTEIEKRELRRVFRDVLNYYVIRIIEGHSGLFALSSRPFTLGNTIYIKNNTTTIPLLVHETTHVWQYQQTGDRYVSDAIAAQLFTVKYDWEKEIKDNHKSDWLEFNAEGQAEFFEDLWVSGRLKDTSGAITQTGNGCFFDADKKNTFGFFEKGGTDYTIIAINAVKTVRNEWF